MHLIQLDRASDTLKSFFLKNLSKNKFIDLNDSTPLDAVAERSRSYGRVRRHGCRGATNMKGAPNEPDAVAEC